MKLIVMTEKDKREIDLETDARVILYLTNDEFGNPEREMVNIFDHHTRTNFSSAFEDSKEKDPTPKKGEPGHFLGVIDKGKEFLQENDLDILPVSTEKFCSIVSNGWGILSSVGLPPTPAAGAGFTYHAALYSFLQNLRGRVVRKEWSTSAILVPFNFLD